MPTRLWDLPGELHILSPAGLNVQNLFSKLSMTASFAQGMRHYLKHPLNPEQAREVIRLRLAEREETFLLLAESRIFGHPSSPYHPLLDHAGCELEDVRSLVKSDGLEAALHTLRRAGVYFTFEEFKGRQPVRRGSLEYTVVPEDFDNPFLGPALKTSTSGSSGRGVQVTMSLDHVGSEAILDLVYYNTIGMDDAPLIMWFGAFPGALGPRMLLRAAKGGFRDVHMFNPCTLEVKSQGERLKQYLIKKSFMGTLRFYGYPYPDPLPIPLDQPDRLARELEKLLRQKGRFLFRGYMSLGLRICVAAHELGISLKGATFTGGGEPVTPAKVRTVTRTGADFYSMYSCAETGVIGAGCLNPISSNDNHLFKDSLALIQASRHVPEAGQDVDALYFTSLLTSAPKIMLNVESDDYAVLEERDCGCPLHELGYTTHVRDIHSFNKLTGQGVSLVGSDAVRVLEEILPQHFGGSFLDYQLAEEEDEHGQTAIWLNVSPKISEKDDARIAAAFLEAVEGDLVANTFAAAQWRKTGALRVRRLQPQWSGRGKLLPLSVQRER